MSYSLIIDHSRWVPGTTWDASDQTDVCLKKVNVLTVQSLQTLIFLSFPVDVASVLCRIQVSHMGQAFLTDLESY